MVWFELSTLETIFVPLIIFFALSWKKITICSTNLTWTNELRQFKQNRSFKKILLWCLNNQFTFCVSLYFLFSRQNGGIATNRDDSKDMLSFLWILRSWLLDCTAHGIPKVVSSANFHWKIFWLIAVIISISCFKYQITLTFQDIFTYPITVSVQITYHENLIMPSLILGNSNKLNESLIWEYDEKVDTQLQKMVVLEGFTSIGMEGIEQTLIGKSTAVRRMWQATRVRKTRLRFLKHKKRRRRRMIATRRCMVSLRQLLQANSFQNRPLYVSFFLKKLVYTKGANITTSGTWIKNY